MAKKSKGGSAREEELKTEEKSPHDRAPYQKNADRDPVKSAEETGTSPARDMGRLSSRVERSHFQTLSGWPRSRF